MKAANLGPPQTPLGRKEIGKEERENKNKNRKRKLLTWGRHQHPGDGKKTLTIFSPHLSPTLRVCTYMCTCVLTFKPLSHSSCVYLHVYVCTYIQTSLPLFVCVLTFKLSSHKRASWSSAAKFKRSKCVKSQNQLPFYTTINLQSLEDTLRRHTFGKYTFGKCTFGKYTFEKCALRFTLYDLRFALFTI